MPAQNQPRSKRPFQSATPTNWSDDGTKRNRPALLNNLSCVVAAQVRHLVTNLTKKTTKSNLAEIQQLRKLYGEETQLYYLKSLVSTIDFTGERSKDSMRVSILNQEIGKMDNLNFTILCQALDDVEIVHQTEDFISQFVKILKLSIGQELIATLAFAQSLISSVSQQAIKHLMKKLPELTGEVALDETLLHHLLSFTSNNEHLRPLGQAFAKNVLRSLPVVSDLLAPLIKDEIPHREMFGQDMPRDSFLDELAATCHISALMEDIGYSCCESPSTLKDLLAQFPPLNELDVARIIGMMARTHAGLDASPQPLFVDFPPKQSNSDRGESNLKTWNINIFSDVIKEMYPRLNWPTVIQNLDHPNFFVSDPKGLATVTVVYKKVTKEPFPLEHLFSQWKNTAGQLSFLKVAVSAPPDVLNFAPSTNRVDIEGIPGGKTGGNVNQAWMSVSLIETLLRLAETENYTVVRNIFNQPIKQCPEVLLLGISQAESTWTNLSYELCQILIPPVLMANTPLSNWVIHKIWNSRPEILIRGMHESFAKNPNSMPRLLEIAIQELKSLTVILDSRPFGFSIEMAALASRREITNLDKWIPEKIAEYDGPFVKACIQHIRDKLTRINKNEPAHKAQYDTTVLLFHAVHNCRNMYTPELFEELTTLTSKLDPQTVAKLNLQESPATKFVSPPLPDPQRRPAAAGNPAPSAVVNRQPAGANPVGELRYAPDVEEYANDYFHKIYNDQLSIEGIITILKDFKNSSDQREQDIYGCMIHNLFDEYRFFPKYPEKYLQITGILFGSLIQHQLVSYLPLGVALRYVLDSLRKGPATKMYKFGLVALEQFKSRLAEWPQYCSHILAIPHIRKTNPEIIEYIEKNANPSQAPGNLTGISANPMNIDAPTFPKEAPKTSILAPQPVHVTNQVAPPGIVKRVAPPTASPSPNLPTTPKPDDIGSRHSLPIDKLINASAADVPKIEDADSGKINFICNNLAPSNMEQKLAEMREILKTEDHFKYLANYLVVKRVCIEINFHQMYLAFLDRLKIPKLITYITSQTYDSIRVLLESPEIVKNVQERSLLKNLGSFLGQLTLSRNKPLLQKDMDIKQMVLDAFENGTLLAVIPFVSNILETCKDSKVFKPPNPWLMAILRLLVEVHNKSNLRLNIKLEIEILFKNLGLDINDVKPTELFKDKKQFSGPGSNDFSLPPSIIAPPVAPPVDFGQVYTPPPPSSLTSSTSKLEIPTGTPSPAPISSKAELYSLGSQITPPPQVSSPAVPAVEETQSPVPTLPKIEETLDNFFAHLANYLHIAPNITLFQQQPMLKRCVAMAIDRAIREIISPVVERSVTIACITTKELILKDFATEGDEAKMRKASHLMVQNLAGSLALVTCKEPLRVSMSNHLRSLLQANATENLFPLVEQAVQIVATENLDLACTLIEKAATEKAVRDTDESLTAAFNARKSFRENSKPGNQPAFADMTYLNRRFPGSLPDSLSPRLGGLLPAQIRVYDDFSRIPQVQAPPFRDSKSEWSPDGSGSNVEALTVPQCLEKLGAMISALDQAVSRQISTNSTLNLAGISPDSEIYNLLKQISPTVQSAASVGEVALSCGQRVFTHLYDSDVLLFQEVHVAVLEILSDIYRKLPRELTNWMSYLDSDEKKFNRVVTLGLIRSMLISFPEYDVQLAKLIMEQKSRAVVEFSVYILRTCIVDRRYLNATDFKETIGVLSKVAKPNDELWKILEEVKKVPGKELEKSRRRILPSSLSMSMADSDDDPISHQFRMDVNSMFEEWMSILKTSIQDENVQLNFVSNLASNLMRDEDKFTRTLLYCTEYAVAFARDPSSRSAPHAAIDAFSRLFFLIFKSSSNPPTKSGLLNRFLGIVVRAIQRDSEVSRQNFNQRPYFRILSNCLTDLISTLDPLHEDFNLAILFCFSNAFMSLSPIRLSGFAFAWLELISHRNFMPKLLVSKGNKGWPVFQQLLVELFKFMEPYLRNAGLSDAIRVLYKGTLRVLLVLLHDFPEFLCDYHFSFCDVIPPSCIQIRNLILSAFPRNMRLPDPFTPNLKVDLLADIHQSPRILSNYLQALPPTFRQEIDSYLKTRTPANFSSEIHSRLLLDAESSHGNTVSFGTRYNVQLLNALVLYLGVQSISQNHNKTPNPAHLPGMEIFSQLSRDLDSEGRYLFLNAIVNQLRYPNNHTHFFSCVLLLLFIEAPQEIIQEQVQLDFKLKIPSRKYEVEIFDCEIFENGKLLDVFKLNTT
eukprot:TRINITY_DN8072_c0_g1_i1.p1 TRINITY_DN8072_c0_g1~~TRINITY_DN8072_c0_g1_i1.p1  ORF type:complete len:2236 (-),score=833.72 TRINITY_DN8072_c0_g1_i1:325-7032(-)